MARNRRRNNRNRRRGKSINQIADQFFKLFATFGAEGATIFFNRNIDGVAQAMSYKTGFNFVDGSFDLSRMAIGWGPITAYEGGKKLKTLAKKLLGGVTV